MSKLQYLIVSIMFFSMANNAYAINVEQEKVNAKALAVKSAKEQRENTMSLLSKPSTMSRTDYKNSAKGAMADIRIRLAELKAVKNRSLAQNLEIVLLEYDVEYLEVMSK